MESRYAGSMQSWCSVTGGVACDELVDGSLSDPGKGLVSSVQSQYVVHLLQ